MLALLWVPAAVAQPGPYVTVSSGSATYSSSDLGSQTRRRDAISAGYSLSSLVALEVSGFQIEEATYYPEQPIHFVPPTFAIKAREKINGFALGPVFRWKLSERTTVFTRQSAVSLQIDETTTYNGGQSSTWNSMVWAYQASVGIDFRLMSATPLSLGVELNHVFTTSGRVKDLTGILLSLSYGF